MPGLRKRRSRRAAVRSDGIHDIRHRGGRGSLQPTFRRVALPQRFAVDHCAPALTVSLATIRASASAYQLKLVEVTAQSPAPSANKPVPIRISSTPAAPVNRQGANVSG